MTVRGGASGERPLGGVAEAAKTGGAAVGMQQVAHVGQGETSASGVSVGAGK